MTTSQLDYAIKDYTEALAALENEKELTSEQVLRLLLTRDAVEVALKERTPGSLPSLMKVMELDKHLKERAEAICQALNLEGCRSTFKSNPDAWWWFLTPPYRLHPWDRFDWFWSALSIPLLTASFSLVTDISSRFLSGGPDTLGAFAVTTQSVVALLAAGGALTKSGQSAIENILVSLNIPRHFQQEAKFGISVVLLTGLLGFHSSLPWLADRYVEQGNRDLAAGRLTRAMNEYQRAQELDPTNVKVHHYMGLLYENLQDNERARAEYRIAAQGGYDPAFNNLARLYILNEKPDAAFALLRKRLDLGEQGIDLAGQLNQLDVSNPDRLKSLFQVTNIKDVPEQLEKYFHRYFVLKNLGWARLQQKRFPEAEGHLQESLNVVNTLATLNEKLAQSQGQTNQKGYLKMRERIQSLLDDSRNGAAAYCLKAQAIEGQEDSKRALPDWDNCLANAVEWDPDEDAWLNLARQRVAQE